MDNEEPDSILNEPYVLTASPLTGSTVNTGPLLTLEEQIHQFLDRQITDDYPDDVTIEKNYNFKGLTYQVCGNIVVRNGVVFCKAKTPESAKEIAHSMNIVYGSF